MPFVDRLFFSAVFLDEVALRAQRNHPPALALQLEEPGDAVAPTVPGRPLLFFRLEFPLELGFHDVFQPFAAGRNVIGVRVHLDQFEVTAVDEPVEEVLIELQHPQLNQLVHRDPNLEGVGYRDPRFQLLQLVRPADFHMLAK